MFTNLLFFVLCFVLALLMSSAGRHSRTQLRVPVRADGHPSRRYRPNER